jgi:hypothetical protein
MRLTRTVPQLAAGFALLDPHTVVSRAFTTTARSEPGDGPSVEVELDVAVDGYGRAHCAEVRVRALALGEPVTREVLRNIPLRRLLHDAVAGLSMKVTETLPDGAQVIEPLTASEREALDERFGRRPRRGSPITDASLRAVADRYREAVERGDPPTQSVARELNVARSTAARWVTKARERDFLGPALKGRAGEAKR